jgi:hypothetical protein
VTIHSVQPGSIISGPTLPEAVEVLAVTPFGTSLKIIGRGLRTGLTYDPVLNATQPDCHFQFGCGGRIFNVLYEVDNATEPLDSQREHSIRSKVRGYECYQDWVLRSWQQHGRVGPRPVFRVVFLTKGIQRVYHILALARDCARNPLRRLCYAATQEEYLSNPLAVTSPLFIDHDGDWQSLVNLHPTSRFLREPVRISRTVAPTGVV